MVCSNSASVNCAFGFGPDVHAEISSRIPTSSLTGSLGILDLLGGAELPHLVGLVVRERSPWNPRDKVRSPSM